MAFGAPKVSVVLELLDRFTKPVNGARNSMDNFGAKALKVFKAVAAGAAAMALGKFFASAVREAAAAELSMARFDAALQNVGTSYAKVAPEAEALFKAIQKTTRYSDDDAREAMTKLTVITGDYGKALNLMQVTADLAAYKQIGLTEAAELVGRASTGNLRVMKELGVTTTDSAGAIAELAEKLRGFAAEDGKSFTGSLERIKNGWSDIKEAVGLAITGNDEVTGSMGVVVDALARLEGWITENRVAVSGFVTGAVHLAEIIGKVLVAVVGRFVENLRTLSERFWTVVHVVQEIPSAAKSAFGSFMATIGRFIQGAGNVLKKFGIDVGDGLATNLINAGTRMRDSAEETRRALDESHRDLVARIRGTGREAQAAASEAGRALPGVVAPAGAAINQIAGRARAAIIDLGAVFGETVPKVVQTVEQELTPATLVAIDTQESFRRKLGEIRQSFAAYQEAAEAATDEQHAARTKQFAGEMVGLLRGLTGAAQAMGGLSDSTATAVQNAINLGEAIGKVASGDAVGGITQGIGSLAGLLKGFLGESEAARKVRLALEGNTKKLEEHRRVIGDLIAIQSPGARLAGVQNVLGGMTEMISALGKARGGAADALQNVFRAELGKRLVGAGLGLDDLDAVAKDLGIGIKTEDGTFITQGLRDLLAALGQIEPTRFREDFTGQRERLRSETDLFNLSETEQARRLVALAGGSLGAGIIGQRFGGLDFSTPEGRAAGIAAVQKLFTDLPTLRAADLGQLNGQQFLDVLADLKGLLSADLPEAVGGAVGDAIEGSGGALGGTAEAPGAPVPAVSLADLVATATRSEGYLEAIADYTRVLPTWTAPGAPNVAVGAGVHLEIHGGINVSAAAGREGIAVSEALIEQIDGALSRRYTQAKLTLGSAAR